MKSKDFHAAALTTESKPEKLNFSLGGTLLILQAAAAMADLVDLVKKSMFYGKVLDSNELANRVGKVQSVLTTITATAHRLGVPEDTAIALHAPNMRVAHGSIGMFTESGELLEAVIKQILTGELDLVNVGEETGDSDWYKAIIHDETGVAEEESRARVIKKLTDKKNGRYKDGFSNEAALSRDLGAERTLLETPSEVQTAAALTQKAIDEARSMGEPRFAGGAELLDSLEKTTQPLAGSTETTGSAAE